MPKERDKWDLKIHHHHTTPKDDEEDGIRRCASCGTPIVIGAECLNCAMKHPGTAAAGWAKLVAKKLLGGK